MGFFQIRGLSAYMLRRNDWALLRHLWQKWSPTNELSDIEWSELKAIYEQPGVLQAMLNYYRQNAAPWKLLASRNTPMTDNAVIPVPTLAMTGTDDGAIDTRLFKHIFIDDNFPAGYKTERIEGAGHFLNRDVPEIINPLIINFLAANTTRIT